MDDASAKEPAAIVEQNGWRLRLPKSPLQFEDARLLEYRHPAEHTMLVLALVAIAFLVALAVRFREKDILLAGGAIYLSMLISSLQSITYNRLEGAEVTPTQFPAIYRMVEELRQRFHAPPTRVFVLRKLSFKAEAMGLIPPYVIVLPSILLDAIDLEDLRYVLGQALGHICFGHTRTTLLVGGEQSELPVFLSSVAWLRDLVFAGYWRAGVMTGDRAGIVACGSVSKAIRTQVKISIGTKQLPDVRAEDLIEQAFKLNRGLSRIQAPLIRWRSPIPPLIPRLEAMVAWAGLPLKETR
ncbi:MAG: M48 family metalloprotease [Deltaproteobacteria bacterium]|nr:M48 family metalloprotease [Deltaproteobacteria bacterium]